MQLALFDICEDEGPFGGRPEQWRKARELTDRERSDYPEPAEGCLVHAHPPHPSGPKHDPGRSVLALRWRGPRGFDYFAATDGYLIQTHPERAGWLPGGWGLNFFPLAWSAAHLDRFHDLCERLLQPGGQDLETAAIRIKAAARPTPLELFRHTRLIIRHLSLSQFGRWSPPQPLRPAKKVTPERALEYQELEDGHKEGRFVIIRNRAYDLTPELGDLLGYVIRNNGCTVNQAMAAMRISKPKTLTSYLSRIRAALKQAGLTDFELKTRQGKGGRGSTLTWSVGEKK